MNSLARRLLTLPLLVGLTHQIRRAPTWLQVTLAALSILLFLALESM